MPYPDPRKGVDPITQGQYQEGEGRGQCPKTNNNTQGREGDIILYPQNQPLYSAGQDFRECVPDIAEPQSNNIHCYLLFHVNFNREDTFQDGLTANRTPQKLSSERFFYTGNGDISRCYFCGGGLRNWKPGDDPWVEHAHWVTKCYRDCICCVHCGRILNPWVLYDDTWGMNNDVTTPCQETEIQTSPVKQPYPPMQGNKLQGQATPCLNHQGQQHREYKYILTPTQHQIQRQQKASTRQQNRRIINKKTEMSTFSTVAISLFTLLMVMPCCFTVKLKGCPRPDYIMHENGICCGIVSCGINFTVSMCEVNYGNDTCAPCPEGSFLLDPTTSETAIRCTEPSCMKYKTRPSLVKSTTFDQFACPQWCQCDLSFNYCGTDPCNCRSMTCPYRTVLQQDCGCSPVTPSPPKPTPSTSKEIAVTQRNVTTPKPRINVTTETSASTEDNTPTPGSVTPFPPGTTKASDSQTPVAIILGIALPVLLIIVIILGIYCFRRMKRKGAKMKTSEPDTAKPGKIINHNYNISVAKADLVQVCKIATMNKNVDGSEDEATENGEVTQPLLNCSPVREQINVVETEAVIEDRPDHTKPDLSMDGPKSSLPGSSSNIQNNVEDEETEVKTVISTNDDAIELQTLSDKGKQSPLVENEDTSLGFYAGEKEIDPETKLETVVSENPLPDSPRKQQNGVCNGHAKSSKLRMFTGFR
ncbi:uncharacterized protein LOC110458830 [Mizuhopecten yessoensis]|uniref:Baculoviral IAP repeat-containing protein 7 n=1 Tax=Mizuhopecten yessoensis TaxID=6573 RepID=A0A210Q5T2_MIZYE|nr:uncharacterized protein LOC110458830 [Mizuhopecten yessoensis]OWF44104.1 Baculoviral IAP repeat-containing protein 7 [Mizuhopecten yessoensis]